MSFLIFFVLWLGTLFGSHYLVYFTTIRSFNITNVKVKRTLFVAMSVLAVSFFVSAFLLRLSSNPATNVFSWISSVWYGLLLHLMIAVAVLWLVKLVVVAVGQTVNMRPVAIGLFVAACLVTTYGVLNSANVRIRHVDVAIEDLPDRWRGSTIVQLSDVHLGSIRGISFFEDVVRRANALNPELIVLTGDLFDGMGGDLASFVEPLSNLSANQGVFFVSGNHEGYLGLTEPLSMVERAGITILDDEVLDLHGLQLVGVSFPEFGMLNKRRSVERLGGSLDPSKPTILLYHTPTDVAESSSGRAEQQSRTYISPDVDFSFARDYGIDLQLSGHTHEGQIFPFTYLTKWIFGGYHYGLHAIGDFRIYISSGTGTWGPPLRTGSRSEIVAIQLH